MLNRYRALVENTDIQNKGSNAFVIPQTFAPLTTSTVLAMDFIEAQDLDTRSVNDPVSNSQFFSCALGIVMPEGACQSTAKPTGKVALKLTRKARIMNLLV